MTPQARIPLQRVLWNLQPARFPHQKSAKTSSPLSMMWVKSVSVLPQGANSRHPRQPTKDARSGWWNMFVALSTFSTWMLGQSRLCSLSMILQLMVLGCSHLEGAKGWAVEVRWWVGEEVNEWCTFSASGINILWRGFSNQVCRGDVVFLCWYFFLDAS